MATTFSCPGCRTDHAISGLPGFAQQRRVVRRSLSTTNTSATVAVTGGRDESLDDGEDLRDTEEEDAYESLDDETYEGDDDDDDFIDDEELDEDESLDDVDDRCVSSVSTKDIYIEIGQLTINF